MTLMVIFGAGASHDSSREYTTQRERDKFRPPLADSLFSETAYFEELLKSFPLSRGLVNHIRRSLEDNGGKGIERILANIRDFGTTQDRRALESVTYYLRAVISDVSEKWYDSNMGNTLYQELVHQVAGWCEGDGNNVVYVTFNYDDLLERAIEDAEVVAPFDHMRCYVNGAQSVTILKPHGSTNWSNPVQVGELEFVRRWYPGKTHAPAMQRPAIAIPVEAKTDSELLWPEPQREAFVRTVPGVTAVLVVGWRASESHFLKSLQEAGLRSDTPFWLVCNDGWPETAGNLSAFGWDQNVTPLPAQGNDSKRSMTFSEFMAVGGLRFLPIGARRQS